jgi:hypothetical protein
MIAWATANVTTSELATELIGHKMLARAQTHGNPLETTGISVGGPVAPGWSEMAQPCGTSGPDRSEPLVPYTQEVGGSIPSPPTSNRAKSGTSEAAQRPGGQFGGVS